MSISIVTATIAAEGTTSGAVVVQGTPIGVLFPAALTGTAISFTVNDGAGTYKAVSGLSVTAVASNWVKIAPTDGVILNDFKIVSNGTEAAARDFKLMVRQV